MHEHCSAQPPLAQLTLVYLESRIISCVDTCHHFKAALNFTHALESTAWKQSLLWPLPHPHPHQRPICTPIYPALIHSCPAPFHINVRSCDGEFGSGWSNANYWYSSASAASHPIAPRLADAARRLAQGDAELEKAAASLTAAGGGGAAGKGGAGGTWDPLRFVGLCARAAEGGDARLLGYCGQLMGREVELLLDHCYEAAAAAAAGRKT
jgi:hypothetical protein